MGKRDSGLCLQGGIWRAAGVAARRRGGMSDELRPPGNDGTRL